MTFTYDPSELLPIDVIRGMAGDTADPGILADETYEAVMNRYGATAVDTAPFFRAAADLLRRVANAIDQKLTSISNPDAGSMGWSASRTKGLRDNADRLDAQAAAIEAEASGGHWGPVVTIRSTYLTGTEGTEATS